MAANSTQNMTGLYFNLYDVIDNINFQRLRVQQAGQGEGIVASALQQEAEVGGGEGVHGLFAGGVFVADLDGDGGGGEPLGDGPAAGAGGSVIVCNLLLAGEE